MEKIWKDTGEDQEELLSRESFGGCNTEVKEIIEKRERQALRNKVKEEKHLEIYGELREDVGTKTYLHGPMDYANKLKLRFCEGDLGDLPEKGKRYSSSRGEVGVVADVCPCGTIIKRRTHIVG